MPHSRNMSSRNTSSDTSDPRALRAVAHPVRLDLLELLHRDGPLTASQCAEQLGLTAKVCSYHLTLLGKYGLIEETGEGKGRARPWRVGARGLSYEHRPAEPASTARAADEFARTMLSRDVRHVEEFIERRHGLPKTWRNVSTMASNPLRLNARQLRELGRELLAVLDKYRRLEEAGARSVHVAIYAVPTQFDEPT
jgi:predicted ArsR family transcriptional regulator